MIRVRGTLLSRALADGVRPELDVAATAELRAAAVEDVPLLPVVLQVGTAQPDPGERWPAFKDRMAQQLGAVIDRLNREVAPDRAVPLHAANSVATALTAEQIDLIETDPRLSLEFAELDPLLDVTAMDVVATDVGLAAFRADAGDLTGAGVKVAVLDSGVDSAHPALVVADRVSTCGEDVAIPGAHGTHCAGILASRDAQVAGIAPGVELIDVKVLRANGSGRHTAVGLGVDEALDREADVLSISIAFNHLPPTLPGGHGWKCRDGTCPLCLAVDNAVLEGALVVVAAGNEHDRCQQARLAGRGLAYDTELGCPGHAARALTVGSLHKTTHAPAYSSSSGPTAYGLAKPDLAAPGVEVLSTIPLPRTAGGVPELNAPRGLQFGVKSGTSMATPVVAGACALLLERARRDGLPADADTIRKQLLSGHVQAVGGPPNVLGAGRLRLG